MKYYKYVSSFSGQATGLVRVEGQLHQRFDRDLMRWIEDPRVFLDISGLGGGGTGDYLPISAKEARQHVEDWGGEWKNA